MPKSRKPDAKVASEVSGYFYWSRDPAMGLFAVLPLWLVYILLRSQLAPAERNGAEVLLLQQFARLGAHVHLAVSILLVGLITLAARSLVKRRVPWSRVLAVLALEGLVYGVMLGPVASAMTSSADRLLSLAPPAGELVANIVGSIGAGIFEELVFRLGLMSVLVLLGMRAVKEWGLPRSLAYAFAVLLSALIFSWFHHFCGEPYERGRFLFRSMAGVLLGGLLCVGGVGVCVYTHTAFNLYFYLRA